MIYNILGSSDVSVSKIALGTWGLGGGSVWTGHDSTVKETAQLLSACREQGISYIDTAPVYHRFRYPLEEKRVRFHCFGNFEAYCDSRPIVFSLSRTKEMLAYLVDRDGTECRKNEIIAALFEDELNIEYYKKLRQDLIRTFSELGIDDAIAVSYGGLAIEKESVKCDYYDYFEGEKKIPPAEYMVQYSWAEETAARLINR